MLFLTPPVFLLLVGLALRVIRFLILVESMALGRFADLDDLDFMCLAWDDAIPYPTMNSEEAKRGFNRYHPSVTTWSQS